MTTNTNAALREKLIDMSAEHLSGTYRCLRVWEAWNFGTMSQDDFDDVGESDTPPELADAILAALSTAARRQQPRMNDNKQYPELPTHFMLVQESFRDEVYLYTADQMRAYADADRAMRATKAAPKPAENTWAQLDAMRSELATDIREVFDANGPETPQIVRDVIEYADSWLQAYIQRKAESPTNLLRQHLRMRRMLRTSKTYASWCECQTLNMWQTLITLPA